MVDEEFLPGLANLQIPQRGLAPKLQRPLKSVLDDSDAHRPSPSVTTPENRRRPPLESPGRSRPSEIGGPLEISRGWAPGVYRNFDLPPPGPFIG